jgi:hypothetical protein
MKKQILCYCLAFIVIAGISSCTQKPNLAAEKTNVKATIDNFTKFWETQDTTLLSNAFDHDNKMVNYGADKNEVFVGYQAFRDSIIKVLPLFEQTKVKVRDQVIEVSPMGDAAWFSEVMDWNLLVNKKPAQLNDQRVTGVLLKKGDKWVIVQFHVSVPVASHL